jgi:hypothetical protein
MLPCSSLLTPCLSIVKGALTVGMTGVDKIRLIELHPELFNRSDVAVSATTANLILENSIPILKKRTLELI